MCLRVYLTRTIVGFSEAPLAHPTGVVSFNYDPSAVLGTAANISAIRYSGGSIKMTFCWSVCLVVLLPGAKLPSTPIDG